MSAATRPALATVEDLLALGEQARAEVIGGAIVHKATPTFEHGRAQSATSSFARRRFDRGGGGRWPGGWWIVTEVEVEYRRHEIYRHDVCGWRRDRVPECPSGFPVRTRPDWVCEILSPSNEKHDLVDKLRVLHAAGVPHYWLLHPREQVLVVHRLDPAGYVVALSASTGETVRAEPFEAIELPVGVLFGDDDID